MTTILAPRPTKRIAHQMCGFCEGGHGQEPGKCHDRHGRCKGTDYGAVPALTLAVAMATLSRARVSSTLASRGPASSSRRAGCSRAVGTPTQRSQPHPRRQVIPHARYDRELRRGPDAMDRMRRISAAAPGRCAPASGPGPRRTAARTWPARRPTCDRSWPSASASTRRFGVVGQRAVPELVQGRAAGRGLEQVLGLPVGQPRPAARRVDVARRQLDAGPAVGQEHRAGLAALQQPRQQAGGAGLPDDRRRSRRPCGAPSPCGWAGRDPRRRGGAPRRSAPRSRTAGATGCARGCRCPRG